MNVAGKLLSAGDELAILSSLTPPGGASLVKRARFGVAVAYPTDRPTTDGPSVSVGRTVSRSDPPPPAEGIPPGD